MAAAVKTHASKCSRPLLHYNQAPIGDFGARGRSGGTAGRSLDGSVFLLLPYFFWFGRGAATERVNSSFDTIEVD